MKTMICDGHVCPGCGVEYAHVVTSEQPCWDAMRKVLRRCDECYRLSTSQQLALAFDGRAVVIPRGRS